MRKIMRKKIAEIKNGYWRAAINLERGANCISLKNEKYGASLLREPPITNELNDPYLYGMPILFPQNRIENGKFEFEGRVYAFPINEPKTNCHLHGELHCAPFEEIGGTDEKIKCRFIATQNEPYLSFPHEFEIIMEYELKGNGLHHSVSVTNLSKTNMPIFLGFHTTFNTLFTRGAMPENIRIFANISEEYERDMLKNYLPTGRILPFDSVSRALFEGSFKPFDKKISRHYRGTGPMTITDIKSGLRLIYENDEKYGFRLIYNGAEDGYICLEPQTCLVNAPNENIPYGESGFHYIAPQETKDYTSKIYLTEVN